ncbi:type I methionyl aminopeptidase [Patescibacteria group bacterium]|nr:type I methionyl aminopeptidase [Patescibacteria group bacterium]
MSLTKSPREIESLKRGGAHLSAILREIREKCVPGVGTAELDALARERMKEIGAKPSFLGYRISPDDPAYPGALCTSINEEVVHGLPIPNRIVQTGDVVGLDIGMWFEGLATDMATTVIAGGTFDKRKEQLVRDTREALVRGIGAIRAGGYIQDIGATIEDFIKPKGYGIVRDLVGHGVGHSVHEEPNVPNFRDPWSTRQRLVEGMVLAIEPMIALGSWKVKTLRDGWTVVTTDRSVCAHFEVTIAVTKDGYDLVTPWPDA